MHTSDISHRKKNIDFFFEVDILNTRCAEITNVLNVKNIILIRNPKIKTGQNGEICRGGKDF